MTKKKATKKKTVKITDGPSNAAINLCLDQKQVVAIMAATLLAADPANRSELAVKKAEDLYRRIND